MSWEQGLGDALRNLETRAGEASIQAQLDEIGQVHRVGDGVAMVQGLQDVNLGEVVVFSGGVRGQVLDLGRDILGCVLFGPQEAIAAGALVRRTGKAPSVPVGAGVLGRVLDPLGEPLDGLGPLASAEARLIEQEAPGPFQRQPVHEPLLTGVKAVDAVIPIGRGQRELILGDRETGKTSLALDAIINQRESGVRCIYVSIGRKRASVVEAAAELRRHGALAHTAVVAADAATPAALRYLAPYAGATIAEWFAYHGEPALVVYDDLTRHAEAYRDLSLTLRHPPGREAYPGDVFSVHARLLERAFKLSDALGGGSVTALPIIETQRGNIVSFIPTNLISITDGQLFLDTALFAEGQLPAVNIGKSVSRVGAGAQPSALRVAAANLRLEVAQYEDVKDFSRFGALLDDATRRQLERGERITSILTQGERATVSLFTLVVELWALKQGLLDAVPPPRLPEFERRLGDLAPQFAHLQPALAADAGITPALEPELQRAADAALAGLRAQEVT